MARNIQIISPLNGKLVPLNSINDPVFSSGAMGRGFAVKNPDGRVFAPFDGEITVFFPTGHAIGLKSDNGIELLIHVGIDTVRMNGEGFTPKAEAGDRIKKGDILLEFDPAKIRRAGYDTTTPVVVTNHTDFGDIDVELDEELFMKPRRHLPVTNLSNLPDEMRVAIMIMDYVGGLDNVRTAETCATRLRLIINDKSKIQEKDVESIDGVKGQFFSQGQYQIILGTGFVDKVWEEFIHLKPSLADKVGTVRINPSRRIRR